MTPEAPAPAVVRPQPGGARAWAPLAMLVVIVGVGLAVRLHRLAGQRFWIDELFSMELSTGRGYADYELPRNVVMESPADLTSMRGAPAWWRVWPEMRSDTHPPLYFMVLRGWRAAFGDGDAAVRAMSVVFSLAAIVGLFVVGRAVNGTAAALWGCAVMAVAPTQVTYGQEARSYAMALAVSLATCVVLIRIERRGATPSRLGALATGLLAMMLTHYFAAGAALGMAIYAFVAMRGRVRRAVLLTFCVAGGLYLLVWGPVLWRQREAFATFNPMGDEPAGHLERTSRRLVVAPLRQFDDRYYPLAWAVAAWGLAAAASWKRWDLLLWWLWAGASLGLIVVSDLWRTSQQLDFAKYTIVAAPALFMIVAAASPWKRGLLRHAVPLLICAGCSAFLKDAYFPWKGNWAGAAEVVSSLSEPGTVVVFDSYDRRWAGNLYLGLRHYRPAWGQPIVILDPQLPAPSELVERLRRAPRVVMVIDWNGADPGQSLPGVRVRPRRTFVNVGTIATVDWPGDMPGEKG